MTTKRIGLAFVALAEVLGVAATWIGDGLPAALGAACFFMAINGIAFLLAGYKNDGVEP